MRAGRDPSSESERLSALVELDLIHEAAVPSLDQLVSLAADVCGASFAAFTAHDAEHAHQLSTSEGAREIMPKGECLCQAPLARGQTVAVPDARIDRRTAEARYVVSQPFVRSFAGAPVGPDPQTLIGVLMIAHTEPGKFGQREIERLEKVAELVNAFLARRREANRASGAATQTEDDRARQLKFEIIFNAINEGVNVFSVDGRILETNPAAHEMFGVTREQHLGLELDDANWKAFRPDGTPFPVNEYPVVATLETGQSSRNVVMGMQPPGGAPLCWISANTAPARNPETGAIEYVVATFKDITAQLEAEKRLNDQNARLAEALTEAEKASRAKSDFLGVMSHELRTPMNAVMSCALLLAQSRLDPVQRRTLGVLEDAGRQMLALLNDLLDLSSLDADKVRIEREPVSLVRLIEGAAVIWTAEIKAKGLSLSVMIDPMLASPRDVDPARLLQIIGNLMANAIKFTSEGGISVQAWPEGCNGNAGRIVIEVEDTGPGVPEEAVQRIFSPFEQADVSTRRRHGGLGVGLHVARRLANAMGGDVRLETQQGEGSRFQVIVEAPLSGFAAPSRQAPTAANDQTEAAPREILCVDDNPRNLYVLGAMLRAAGHRTTEVSSGAEALGQLAMRKFDVVLLDMVMPDMDGIDMLGRLRTMGGLNLDTPVIACTANVLPDQVEAYRKAGTVGVLAKPIDIRAMLQAVTAAA